MDQNQALNTIVQGINVAQQRGAFSLKEASVLSSAVEVFVPPEEETEGEESSEDAEKTEEATEETE
jgi:hypothetical protein